MDYEGIVWFVYACFEMLLTFFYGSLLAGLALAVVALIAKATRRKPKKEEKEVENSGNMNDYLDNILSTAALKIHKLNADPLNIPDSNRQFERTILNMKATGGLETKKGKLRGLSTVHRAGDATLNFDSLTSLSARATLGIHNMSFGWDAKAWLNNKIVNFFLGLQIEYLKGTAEFEVPLLGGGEPKATTLIIDEIGKITLTVRNLGPFNRLVQWLGFAVLNLLRGVLKDKLAEPIQAAVNELLAKVKVPSLLF